MKIEQHFSLHCRNRSTNIDFPWFSYSISVFSFIVDSIGCTQWMRVIWIRCIEIHSIFRFVYFHTLHLLLPMCARVLNDMELCSFFTLCNYLTTKWIPFYPIQLSLCYLSMWPTFILYLFSLFKVITLKRHFALNSRFFSFQKTVWKWCVQFMLFCECIEKSKFKR